ncbi:MAG: class II aldolase/adducin family protein [Gammaproteobacteria bacterium]|nr:MAG: class II aldolase/adducin family protein [Gammaproteobacteria bacterium]
MDIRQDLVRVYRWLRRHGLNDSHSGNASVRDGDGFWITPSGAGADRLRARDLVRCPLEGPLPKAASLDAPLHRAVYRAQPEAAAVLHSHGPATIAVTLDGRDFHPVDFEGQYYFRRVPVLRMPYGAYLEQAPAAVAAALAEHPVAVVCGHGAYAWGSSLDLAYKWTCSLESSARLWLLARQAGTLAAAPEPFPGE